MIFLSFNFLLFCLPALCLFPQQVPAEDVNDDFVKEIVDANYIPIVEHTTDSNLEEISFSGSEEQSDDNDDIIGTENPEEPDTNDSAETTLGPQSKEAMTTVPVEFTADSLTLATIQVTEDEEEHSEEITTVSSTLSTVKMTPPPTTPFKLIASFAAWRLHHQHNRPTGLKDRFLERIAATVHKPVMALTKPSLPTTTVKPTPTTTIITSIRSRSPVPPPFKTPICTTLDLIIATDCTFFSSSEEFTESVRPILKGFIDMLDPCIDLRIAAVEYSSQVKVRLNLDKHLSSSKARHVLTREYTVGSTGFESGITAVVESAFSDIRTKLLEPSKGHRHQANTYVFLFTGSDPAVLSKAVSEAERLRLEGVVIVVFDYGSATGSEKLRILANSPSLHFPIEHKIIDSQVLRDIQQALAKHVHAEIAVASARGPIFPEIADIEKSTNESTEQFSDETSSFPMSPASPTSSALLTSPASSLSPTGSLLQPSPTFTSKSDINRAQMKCGSPDVVFIIDRCYFDVTAFKSTILPLLRTFADSASPCVDLRVSVVEYRSIVKVRSWLVDHVPTERALRYLHTFDDNGVGDLGSDWGCNLGKALEIVVNRALLPVRGHRHGSLPHVLLFTGSDPLSTSSAINQAENLRIFRTAVVRVFGFGSSYNKEVARVLANSPSYFYALPAAASFSLSEGDNVLPVMADTINVFKQITE